MGASEMLDAATADEISDASRAYLSRQGEEDPEFMELSAEERALYLVACEVCGRTKAWHMLNHTRHKFSDDGEFVAAEDPNAPGEGELRAEPAPADRVGIAQGSSDLPLRALLIKKGLIAPGELEVIEAEIEATGMVIVEAPAPGIRTRDPQPIGPDGHHFRDPEPMEPGL